MEYETFVSNFQFNILSKSFIRCGSCFNCKKMNAIEWTQKAKFEMYHSKYAYFITLTYNNENVPLELNTRDYQLFLKRFRKWLDKQHQMKLRYLVAGEYGARYSRPHYHMIVFMDLDISDTFYKVAKRQFSSRLIEQFWQLGFISIAPANESTIAYTAFYSTKKLTKAQKFSFVKKNSDTGLLPKSEFIYASNGFGQQHVKNNLDYFVENWNILPKSLLKESIFGKDFINEIKELKQYYMFELHQNVDWKKQRLEYYAIEQKQRQSLYNKRLLNKFK